MDEPPAGHSRGQGVKPKTSYLSARLLPTDAAEGPLDGESLYVTYVTEG